MNLLKTKKPLNQEKTFYVDYKISKNGTTIEVFSIFFVTFNNKKIILSKAFIRIDIHQILRLNYCKNYKSGEQKTLMEFLLVLTCMKTQKIQ